VKKLRVSSIYEWGLLAVLFLIVVHAPLAVGFGSLLPDYATPIKAWKEIALGLLAIVAIILIQRHNLWHAVLHNRLLLLCMVFIDVHLLFALTGLDDTSPVVAGLMIDLRFIVMFMLMYVLVLIRPDSLRRIIRVVAAGAVVVIGFGLLQVTVLPDNVLSRLGYSNDTITPYTTIDRNPDFVRINSTLRGPNPLGALMVIYIGLIAAYLLRRTSTVDVRLRLVAGGVMIGAVVVLFASFSRSAYAGAVAALMAAGLAIRRPSKRILTTGAVVVAVVGIGLFYLSSTDWFSNVILHVDPESTVAAKSNAGHFASLTSSANRLVSQPFGAGIGSTGSASLYDGSPANDVIIENYYFFVAHEAGWLGLALFLIILVYVFKRLWLRRASWLALGLFASGVGLSLIGLLLPVWADETVSLIWWGLAGAVIAAPSGIIGARYAAKSRQQKTTRTT
jgi:hypothetical protein